MGLILQLIGGFLGRFGKSIATALAAFWAGRTTAKNQQLKNTAKREKDARNAMAKEKADADGLSRSDLIERMRRRDDDWGGV